VTGGGLGSLHGSRDGKAEASWWLGNCPASRYQRRLYRHRLCPKSTTSTTRPLTIPTAIHKLHLLFYYPIVVRPCGDSRTDCCYHNRCLLWVALIPSPPPHRPRPRNFLLDTPQNKRLPSWSEHPLLRVAVAFTRRLRLATAQSTTSMSRIHLDDLRELPPTSPTSSHHRACHCRAPHAP
jgi:hypothetical protein